MQTESLISVVNGEPKIIKMCINILSGYLLIILIAGCNHKSGEDKFLRETEKIEKLPSKNRLWVFIMAGQSNMAGRAAIAPQDTVSDPRIITINKDNEWIVAKEPLHFYEPSMTGLDCGLSFGRELINTLNDSTMIAMIPCAVGGSSIEQWVGDSVHREVKLLSNLKEKIDLAKEYGIIKGILWHQGENDANTKLTAGYRNKLSKLFLEIRDHIDNDSLPVLIAELGSFAKPAQKQEVWDSLNYELIKLADSDSNIYIIETKDLKDKGDNLHFNSEAQRTIGKRFAEKYAENCK